MVGSFMKSNLNIKNMRTAAKKRGGKCLSKLYKNQYVRLKWKCKRGHIWHAPDCRIRANHWCPVCAGIIKLTLKDMKGLNVFVTAGPTYEYIDPIRVLTNRSTGKMGFALAREAWRRGANVTLVSGPTMLTSPYSVDYSSITTTHELINTIKSKMKEKKYDIFLAAAAPSDFRPVNTNAEKMSSRITKPFNIQFEATEKVINIVKNIQHDIFL
jgi:phosphopantothenoylcysteine synthetase/decarboxylase